MLIELTNLSHKTENLPTINKEAKKEILSAIKSIQNNNFKENKNK